eukprot:6782721-Pyramimonas_sp.AAC.1
MLFVFAARPPRVRGMMEFREGPRQAQSRGEEIDHLRWSPLAPLGFLPARSRAELRVLVPKAVSHIRRGPLVVAAPSTSHRVHWS